MLVHEGRQSEHRHHHKPAARVDDKKVVKKRRILSCSRSFDCSPCISYCLCAFATRNALTVKSSRNDISCMRNEESLATKRSRNYVVDVFVLPRAGEARHGK